MIFYIPQYQYLNKYVWHLTLSLATAQIFQNIFLRVFLLDSGIFKVGWKQRLNDN